MIKFYKDASTRYASINLTKWFGLKIEPTRDGGNNSGIHFFAWYPAGNNKLSHCSAWLPLPFVKFK